MEIAVGGILLAIVVLMFVLACEKGKAGIWDRERQTRGLFTSAKRPLGGPPQLAQPARRQGRSIKSISDRPFADPDDAVRKLLDKVRASNKALLDAGQIIGEYLEPGPREAELMLNRLNAVLDKELTAALERIDKPDQ